MFKAVLFDLDGTLLDTLRDLADAMNQALQQMGFASHPVERYADFVGEGIYNEAYRALPQGHRDEATINECVELTRGFYKQNWNVHTDIYPGIAEMLDGLQQRGFPKSILSNKPDDFTNLIADRMLGKWEFDVVRGLRGNSRKKPDPSVAFEIAEKMGVKPEEFIYLGDMDTDMQTAKNAGMCPVGAGWGFRPREELIEHGARRILDKPQELLKMVDAENS